MKIRNITDYLENIAPPSYQESYDNSGLLIGNPDTELTGVLLCLDTLETVLEEAIDKRCNLIIAHHPIVFRGLKRFNGKNYVERVVMKAIQYEIAIYAIHTNLDNVLFNGVNTRIADKLGLVNRQILSPKQLSGKINTKISSLETSKLKKALTELNVIWGNDNTPSDFYTSLSTTSATESPQAVLNLSFYYPLGQERQILNTIRAHHPDGEKAFIERTTIQNPSATVGSGIIGTLEKPISEKKFLMEIQKKMKASCIRHTQLRGKKVKRVAVCGGAGSFLLSKAIAAQADFFVSADFKYHEFFDAESKIVIADIGHYESEQYTIQLLYDLITEKFSNFAVYLTQINTNPIHYFT